MAETPQPREIDRQWWLVKLNQHGNPTLADGGHSDRAGVEQAAYLLNRLGLTKGGERYACAEIIITPVEAKPHGANEEAITTLNEIGLNPHA